MQSESFSAEKICFSYTYQGKGILLVILGRGVPPDSAIPDPISDQNMLFFATDFRPDFAVTNFPTSFAVV